MRWRACMNHLIDTKWKKGVGIGIVILIICLLFLLRSCTQQKTTGNPIEYGKHIAESIDKQEETKDALEDYLSDIGPRLIDCEEDVAIQLSVFGDTFIKEAETYGALTYNGSEIVPSAVQYETMSQHYRSIGETLKQISKCMKAKDKDGIIQGYDALEEVMRSVEVVGETYE